MFGGASHSNQRSRKLEAETGRFFSICRPFTPLTQSICAHGQYRGRASGRARRLQNHATPRVFEGRVLRRAGSTIRQFPIAFLCGHELVPASCHIEQPLLCFRHHSFICSREASERAQASRRRRRLRALTSLSCCSCWQLSFPALKTHTGSPVIKDA